MEAVDVIVQDLRRRLDALGAVPLADRVALANALTQVVQEFLALPHPVAGVQWVPAASVRANTYNPNRVAPPEMKLLRLSIVKDGLTMPVVTAPGEAGTRVVVDGFHRTVLIQTCPEIHASTGGFVPVVELPKTLEERMTATVRHNLARGTHQVELSAQLVTALKKHHWTDARIGQELGMEPDEVLRLKQITGLAEAFRDHEFSQAWE